MMSHPAKQSGAARHQVYEWLRERIAQTDPEEPAFIIEREVAEETGTSRTPVREALLQLEVQGFVKMLPNRGAFVPPITFRDVKNVMEIRAMVEGHCADILHGSTTLRDRLLELVEEQEALTLPGLFIDADRVFHTTLVTFADNELLSNLYDELRERQRRMGVFAIASSATRRQDVIAEHRRIALAVTASDPAELVNAIRAHLDHTQAALEQLGDRRARRQS